MEEPKKRCVNCGKEISRYVNFCDRYECHIEHSEKNGGKKFCPNGLKPRSFRADFNMYECEHGDHKDYMFPVNVEFTGDPEIVTTRDEDGNVVCVQDQELHALIYTDGNIAVTMYECEYFTWLISSGGREYKIESTREIGWKLTETSIRNVLRGKYSDSKG